MIFALLFITNFIGNFDHGIVPAINTVLKDEFNLNNVQVGSLGSLVYLGCVVGKCSPLC